MGLNFFEKDACGESAILPKNVFLNKYFPRFSFRFVVIICCWRLLTVVRFSKYLFPQKYLQGRALGSEKPKTLSVSSGSLIVMKWQKKNIISNRNIQQNLAKEFTFYSAESYSEPCQTSKVDLFSKIDYQPSLVNQFYKKFHLRCLTGF